MAQEILAQYFDEESRFIEAVKRGEAALQRGDSLTQEEVGNRLAHIPWCAGLALII